MSSAAENPGLWNRLVGLVRRPEHPLPSARPQLVRPEPPIPSPPAKPLLRRCCYIFRNEGICILLLLGVLSIVVLAGLHGTSRDPATALEATTIYSLSFTGNGTDQLAAISNISVTFQVQNPNTVVGFKHKYMDTLVSAFFNEMLWSRSRLPQFSQKPKSSSNMTAYLVVDGVVYNVTCLVNVSQSDIVLRISVDARVKQNSRKTIEQELRWFNLTCLVEMSMPTTSGAGQMLGKTCTESIEPSILHQN